jgi:hypothetical protein
LTISLKFHSGKNVQPILLLLLTPAMAVITMELITMVPTIMGLQVVVIIIMALTQELTKQLLALHQVLLVGKLQLELLCH